MEGGIHIHITGRFLDPGQVGGLVDTLKNSGIQRRDMIISSYDEEKFVEMDDNIRTSAPMIMTDEDDIGELRAFLDGTQKLSEGNGMIVCVKAARHKAQEVKSVMEQSGAAEVIMDDK